MVIIINGPSSAGKSTLAKALQEAYPQPIFLHSIDDRVLRGLGYRYVTRNLDSLSHQKPDWFFRVSQPDSSGHLSTAIQDGPLANKLHADMAMALGLLHQQGWSILLDELLGDRTAFGHYAKAFSGINSVYLIYLSCDLVTNEARELARGNRWIGLARGTREATLEGVPHYDLVLDSSEDMPDLLAKKVLDFIAKTPNPQAFTKSCREQEVADG